MALQIKRRIGGAAGPPPSLAAGQLAYNDNGSELFVGDGSAIDTLVSADRQVELAGAQTITGAKTIDVDDLHVTGGIDGDILTTDGNGVLSWEPQQSITVTTEAPLIGNGSAATPLGLEPATAAQVTTGTDDVYPITSARLRDKLGAEVSTLVTIAKTVVPAINELAGEIEALAGPVRLVGTYDAATHQVTPSANSPATAGPLPAAAPANNGWVFVVDEAGTGVAPAPAVAMSPGDWLLSTGAAWVHLDLNAPSTVASNVAVTAIAGLSASDVQAALAEIMGGELVAVAVDPDTMSGDGTTANPLSALLDDGVY